MTQEIELAVSPEDAFDAGKLRQLIVAKLSNKNFTSFSILKRSIDARSKSVVYRLKIAVKYGEEESSSVSFAFKDVANAPRVAIVGAGPAGLFAALRCLELGLKPVLFERGKDVRQRRRDLAQIHRTGMVNAESNYCFGEGGAGTYSDGKLYTRSNKRGDINKVLSLFVHFGADQDILVDARPHIGTNKLPQIITKMREQVQNAGGEVYFESKLTDIKVAFGALKAIQINHEEWMDFDALILATGHSARDIFELLHRREVLIEAKPFALGVRIEHPQSVVDKAQYHCDVRSPFLPPAYYSLVTQVQDKGVFSFCMCPGGIIAPCATDEQEVVVNGWSPSKRNNPFANSGTVVQVELKDVAQVANNPLAMLNFQKEVEQRAFRLGGGGMVAPAQRMEDFVKGKLSDTLPINSYQLGLKSVDMNEVLPKFVYHSLRNALPEFGRKMRGYFTNEAVLVGVESRTSSPIKIPRDRETLQHVAVQGLFPCGEGAGYAGGIVSAAIDGMACAEAVSKLGAKA